MKKGIGTTLFFILVFICCSETSTEPEVIDYIFEEVQENYSHIIDPIERWDSYNLESYALFEREYSSHFTQWGAYAIFDTGGKTDLIDSTIWYRSWNENDIPREIILDRIRTVKELFSLIENFKSDSSLVIDVEYDSVFGYPVNICSSPKDTNIIDGEYSFHAYKLMRVVN